MTQRKITPGDLVRLTSDDSLLLRHRGMVGTVTATERAHRDGWPISGTSDTLAQDKVTVQLLGNGMVATARADQTELVDLSRGQELADTIAAQSSLRTFWIVEEPGATIAFGDLDRAIAHFRKSTGDPDAVAHDLDTGMGHILYAYRTHCLSGVLADIAELAAQDGLRADEAPGA